MFTETIDLTAETAADCGAEPYPPLPRLEERFRDDGDFTPPPIRLPFEADDRLEEYGGDSFGLAGWDSEPDGLPSFEDDPPAESDRAWYSRWLPVLSDHQPAPAIAEQVGLAAFPTETTFPGRIFEVANLLLDVSDPVCKWIAGRIAQLGYRAEFFGAASGDEYDAIEAEQERWLSEQGGGR